VNHEINKANLHRAELLVNLFSDYLKLTAIHMTDPTEKTLFEKIIAREIPANFVHEDETCVAIKDIAPKAPVHYLIIPRKPIPGVHMLEDEDWPTVLHLFQVAKKLAERDGCEGYRLQFNVGEKGGQEVPHLHLHLMGWLGQ
jgi:histidine triad (HIT) family protein